jgi:FKBP-type peptidyl-prolyl cis-trans isomerase
MNIRVLIVVLSLAGLVFTAEPALSRGEQPATQPAGYLNDAGYGIGYQVGKQLKSAGVALDLDAVVAGLRDSVAGKESKVSPAAIKQAMARLQQDAEAAAKDKGTQNVKLGDEFRAENGKKKSVTTTASGLQIETLTEGTGPSPKPTDTVKVHYTGKLIDGTTFDSSVDRGEPAVFPLNGVIPGWTEGLQLMKVGGKARLVIPPSIGYGAAGQGPIGPNATLIFEVELLAIEKQ